MHIAISVEAQQTPEVGKFVSVQAEYGSTALMPSDMLSSVACNTLAVLRDCCSLWRKSCVICSASCSARVFDRARLKYSSDSSMLMTAPVIRMVNGAWFWPQQFGIYLRLRLCKWLLP